MAQMKLKEALVLKTLWTQVLLVFSIIAMIIGYCFGTHVHDELQYHGFALWVPQGAQVFHGTFNKGQGAAMIGLDEYQKKVGSLPGQCLFLSKGADHCGDVVVTYVATISGVNIAADRGINLPPGQILAASSVCPEGWWYDEEKQSVMAASFSSPKFVINLVLLLVFWAFRIVILSHVIRLVFLTWLWHRDKKWLRKELASIHLSSP